MSSSNACTSATVRKGCHPISHPDHRSAEFFHAPGVTTGVALIDPSDRVSIQSAGDNPRD